MSCGLIELEDQETRVAAVQEAEPVTPRLDLEERPRPPLTTIVFPKNSGFQIGETSLSGM